VTLITAVTFSHTAKVVKIIGYVYAVNNIVIISGTHMKRLSPIVILVLSYTLAPAMLAQNPQPSAERGRPVIVKVAPAYPAVARRIHLGGTVKAIALVGSDGKVKKVDAVGGSPLLMQAAQDAISHWKFAPGQETQEAVELHFTP